MLITISSSELLGQTGDSLSKSSMVEMSKEMELMKQNLKPHKTESFVDYFKPELIDSFFKYIIRADFDNLYEKSDELIKRNQSKDELEKYFKAVRLYYGQIKTYEKETYTIQSQWMSSNLLAGASYKVKFEKANATVSTAFDVIDSLTITLQTFVITTDSFTSINKFDTICNPTFDYLIHRDYPGLYNSTSKRFQEYTSLGKYEEFTKQLKDIDFSKRKQYQNRIGVVDGNLTLNIAYFISESKGYLTLTYTEMDNKFYLEGFNYNPKTK